MARWRMPPENSWGYCLKRSSGLGMPARASVSRAVFLASALDLLPYFIMPSTICLPTVIVGLRLVMGS